jgi:hypothetical protein
MLDFILFWGNYCEEKLVIPGVAEGVDVIVDLDNLSISDINLEFVR